MSGGMLWNRGLIDLTLCAVHECEIMTRDAMGRTLASEPDDRTLWVPLCTEHRRQVHENPAILPRWSDGIDAMMAPVVGDVVQRMLGAGPSGDTVGEAQAIQRTTGDAATGSAVAGHEPDPALVTRRKTQHEPPEVPR